MASEMQQDDYVYRSQVNVCVLSSWGLRFVQCFSAV